MRENIKKHKQKSEQQSSHSPHSRRELVKFYDAIVRERNSSRSRSSKKRQQQLTPHLKALSSKSASNKSNTYSPRKAMLGLEIFKYINKKKTDQKKKDAA